MQPNAKYKSGFVTIIGNPSSGKSTLINALVGGIALIIINWIGAFFGFHIDLNFFSALITGALGVPGIIILLILKAFI